MADRTRAGAFPARAWLERLIAPLETAATILDLGCGGGEPIARFLIDRGFRVTGVDLATTQIELSHTRFPLHRWLRADMRTIVLDETFDAVVAWNSLRWLNHADRWRMLARAAAWLAPGGRLLFTAQPDDDPALGDYRDGTPWRDDLAAESYEAQLAKCGLIDLANTPADPACDDAAVWLVRKPDGLAV